MTASTKDLIEQLRRYPKEFRLVMQAADALERLTQPEGVEPAGCVDGPDGCQIDYYSAETVARLIAERDELDRLHTNQMRTILALQEQVKALRELVRNSTEYRLGVPAYELAATEPKEKS